MTDDPGRMRESLSGQQPMTSYISALKTSAVSLLSNRGRAGPYALRQQMTQTGS